MANLGPESPPRDPHPSSPAEQPAPSHPLLPFHGRRLGGHQALHPVLGVSPAFPAAGVRPPLTASPGALRPRRAGRSRSTRKVPSELSFSLKTNAFSPSFPPETLRQPLTPTALAAGQVPEKRQQSHGTSCVPGRRSRRCHCRLLLLLLVRRRPHASLRGPGGGGSPAAKGAGQRLLLLPPARTAAKGESPGTVPRLPPRAGLARRRMELLPQTRPNARPLPGSPLRSEDLRFLGKLSLGVAVAGAGALPQRCPSSRQGPALPRQRPAQLAL